ncbi:MAG TPA: hypothetical protein VFQ05_10585 [Candidatus Eisenbacteria bacterium]|nr:hypothetical protein [Candidatus Eisenbacteria bacterium]
MRAARILSCVAVLMIGWTAVGSTAASRFHRTAKPAKGTIIDNSQRIDVNNISMVVTNTGSFAYDKATGGSGLEFPKGTGKTAVFAAGLWLGGEVGGATRLAVSEYSDEYGPGAMVGTAPDDPDKAEYKVYKLNRVYTSTAERDAALADYEAGAETHGAPDVEVQADGTLNILGDQMLWAVYNDADPANHTNRAGSTSPLGIEVQQTTFAFNRVGALGNTIFMRYIFINKGGNTINNMFVSQWSDPDLGGAFDDLVGSDVPRSLGYVYNATNSDGQYGEASPAVGYDFFKGPEVGGAPLPMSSFNKYINGTDPNTAAKTFNYMKGLDADGNVIINPVTGTPTTFFVSGDPVTNTGWLDTSPDDRRLMLSSGPFTMAPGDTQEVVCAIVVSQGTNRLSSVTLLRCDDDIAQSAFDQNFDLANPPNPPVVTSTLDDGAIRLSWDTSSESYDEAPYNFEGYIVYQGASIAGPFTPVGTFDIANSITTVLDNECDADLGVILPRVKARGSDSGLRYSITLTADAVRGGPLHSGTAYYYAVTAYAVGIGQTPVFLESPRNVMTLIPQSPPAGRDFSSARIVSGPTYGQVDPNLPPTRDSVTVRVVHQDSVRTASYRVGYKPDATGTATWYLVRTMGAQVDTVLNNMTNFGADEAFPIVDGIEVRVLGAIYNPLADVQYVNVGPNPPAYDGVAAIGLHFFDGGADYAFNLFGSALDPVANGSQFPNLEIRFTGGPPGQKAYRYVRASGQYLLQDYVDVPWTIWDVDQNVQLNAGFLENAPTANGAWNPDTTEATLGNREVIWPMRSAYSPTALPFYQDPVRDDALNEVDQLDFLYALWPHATVDALGAQIPADPGDNIRYSLDPIPATAGIPTGETENDFYAFNMQAATVLSASLAQNEMTRIKAVPNPYFNHSSYELNQFNRQIKFTHLPVRCTVRIFNLAGDLVRTMEKNDNSSQLIWDIETSHGLPVASGIYVFHVDAPGIGTHVGKLAIFMEKERLNTF